MVGDPTGWAGWGEVTNLGYQAGEFGVREFLDLLLQTFCEFIHFYNEQNHIYNHKKETFFLKGTKRGVTRTKHRNRTGEEGCRENVKTVQRLEASIAVV